MVSFSKVYVNCQNFVVKIILQLNVVSYDRYENCDFFMCLFVFQTLQSDKYQAKKKESMADDLTIFQQNQIRNWYIIVRPNVRSVELLVQFADQKNQET